MWQFCQVGLGLIVTVLATVPLLSQSRPIPGYVDDLPRTHPAIDYEGRKPQDAVARLLATPCHWNTSARSDQSRLANLLTLLGIDVDSQVLVFSKTSFQSALISPRNPRAIYFNDEVEVGYVRGSPLVEVSALDRAGGNQFYTVDLRAASPAFQRQETCLRCHQGVATQGVPGVYVGSVFPAANGRASKVGAIITDGRSAFEDRWGGWYVNARTRLPQSRGNITAVDPVAPTVLDEAGGPRRDVPSLLSAFDPRYYLSNASDVIALMTLEHQTQATNLITRLSWISKLATATTSSRESLRDEDTAVEDLLRFLLFVDEQPLPAPVEGVSAFARRFSVRGPRDRYGRSLRDFDLKTRLFRHPLSYMIYSPGFDALPPRARDKFSARLRAVLCARDTSDLAEKVLQDVRAKILLILRDTKPELIRGAPAT